jgi:predicted N-formylglutamate amidohydrolase
MTYRLLDPDEPPPVLEVGRERSSAFVIAVDHASARIPRRLDRLGLPPAELERHIAWDIGALEIAKRVAVDLDAPLLATNYSRLVIDCNRDPRVPSSIPTIGESVEVPGNVGLSGEEVAARRREIFEPYHTRLCELLDERQRAGRTTILVAQHTMTDVFKGARRGMHAAVLYNRDARFAALVLEALRAESGLVVGDNEPYFLSDETDYTIPRHAEARSLLHVEIEVRQDLVGGAAGQAEWAVRIARALRFAQRKLTGAER